MKKDNQLKKIAIYSMAALAYGVAQNAFAHTRLQIPVIDENTRVYNNEVIAHGCHNPVTNSNSNAVVGTSVVFPDGLDSTIAVDGQVVSQPLTDFVQNWGNLNQKIQSRDLFITEAEKTDSLGNVVGFWGALGGMPGTYTGLNPFRTSAVIIEPTSCANSVTFVVPIADICTFTPISGFSDETVNLWTPAVGSNFDGPGLHGFDSPATLKVNRTSALPASCGAGVDVTVTPSAAQINRDMPIVVDGVQVWPTP